MSYARSLQKALPAWSDADLFQPSVYPQLSGNVVTPLSGNELLGLTLGVLNNPYFCSGKINLNKFFPQNVVQTFIINSLAMPERLMLEWAKPLYPSSPRALATRDNLPESVIQLLLNHGDSHVLGNLLLNPTVPSEYKTFIGLMGEKPNTSSFRFYRRPINDRLGSNTNPYGYLAREWDLLYFKFLEPLPANHLYGEDFRLTKISHNLVGF